MPVDIAAIRKPRTGVMAISAVTIVGGVGLILLWAGSQKKAQQVTLRQIAPGEWMSLPTAPLLSDTRPITVRIGEPIELVRPTVLYQGPGRDTFSYFQVKQMMGGQWVTVYGSGVAGVHVGPAAEPTQFTLVGAEQVQPSGCPQFGLCAYPWPGPSPTPICGAPAVPGPGKAVLQVYQRLRPEDGDGFASPTCGAAGTDRPRTPVIEFEVPNKISFVA